MTSVGNTKDNIIGSGSIRRGSDTEEAITSVPENQEISTPRSPVWHENPDPGERFQVEIAEVEGQSRESRDEELGFDSDGAISGDDEKANISTAHRKFLEAFREYWNIEGPNGDISAFASRLKNLNQSLDKSDDMQRTLLHLIASRGFDLLDGGEYLVRWLMDKYPGLYRTVDDLGRSILDTALRSGMNTERDRDSIIRLFVQEFPTQTADLLKPEDTGVLHFLVAKLIWFDCPEIFFQRLGKELILYSDKKEGNTLLHIAARCREQKPLMDVAGYQLEVVTRIFGVCPEALFVLNHKGQSAYQHRLHSCSSNPDVVPPISSDDPIAWFLKTEIMNLKNREEILQLLYGQSQGVEIEFDLSDFPNLDTVEKGSLMKLLESLKFESILSYVRLPRYTLREDPSLQNLWKTRSSIPLLGHYEMIFRFFRLKNVRKIVRVIVQDGEIPHKDEAIERMLSDFDVEEWDWKKIDICSEVILSAAPNTRKLSLYSSGNNAVLRSWSAMDGLARLQKLEDVRVTVREKLEGRERTREYVKSFIDRMAHCLPSAHVTVQIEDNDEQNINNNVSVRRGQYSWFHQMEEFAQFIQATSKKRDSGRGVRVALIDDGVDLLQPALEKTVKKGISFTSKSYTLETKPYYLSSCGHGTLMATLISRICPTAELYVARIDDHLTGQLKIDSAAKALEWAIANEVDIICMSWALEVRNDHGGAYRLDHAIRRAIYSDILIFASAIDSGTSPRATLPADLTRVFAIGGATAMGKPSPWMDGKRINFFLPGSNPGIKLPHGTNTNDSDDDIISGSSIATALAAGLAGLILYCVEICGLGEEWRRQLQSYDGMARLLQEMTHDSQFIGKTEIFFNPNIMKLDRDEVLEVFGQDIQRLFKEVLR